MTWIPDKQTFNVLHFVMFQIAYDNGITRQNSFILLTSIILIPLLTTFLLFPKFKFLNPSNTKSIEAGQAGVKSSDCGNNKDGAKGKAEGKVDLSVETKPPTENPTLQEIRVYFKDTTFLLHLLWFSLGVLHINYFFGQLLPWITSLAKDAAEGMWIQNVLLHML